ncbi:MAG: condensation domain-containing protein [Caldilineaceae bacterium]
MATFDTRQHGGETIWRYWQQQLADVPKELTLPTDYPRPTAISHRGAALRFRFPDELTHQLQRLARQQNLPLSTIVQSTLHLLIHQLSGQDDIVIGLVVTNRTRPELVHVVGDLTDHMPVRSCWVAEMSLIDYLKRLHTTTQQALAHQNYPSALIIQGLQTNLNSILLNYLHTDWMGYQQADSLTTEKPNMLRLEPYEFPFTVTGHWAEDLIVTVKEAPNQIGGYVSYNPDLFTEMTIMQMIDRFQQLLEHVALNPKSSLSALCD